MFGASDQVEVCDLLFGQVGCTSSQPEISPGPFIPFLTVMDLNLFSSEIVQLPNIHPLRSVAGDCDSGRLGIFFILPFLCAHFLPLSILMGV